MKTSQKSAKGGLLKEIKDSFEKNDSFADFNSQLFNASETPFGAENPWLNTQPEKKEPRRIRHSEVVFNFLERQEQSRLTSEIQNLMKEVKKEIEMLKVQDKSLLQDISKLTISELPEKPGIYHLRFLEFIIKLLRSIRQKISEGRLWLRAGLDKRKQKRFRQLARVKGTKFSMSKELTQANTPG